MGNDYEMVTEGGYPFDEAVSALQKTIRRGLEKEALYWAIEINSKYPVYLWKRLLVIVTEDIGGANPDLVTQVAAMMPAVIYVRKENKRKEYDLCILAHIILAMARSPKSREADDMVNAILRERREGQMFLAVPDYALDKHTKRGRKLKRGATYFWQDGANLKNEAYPSQYIGWDPEFGDGYHTADGRKAEAKLKGSERNKEQKELGSLFDRDPSLD